MLYITIFDAKPDNELDKTGDEIEIFIKFYIYEGYDVVSKVILSKFYRKHQDGY